MRKTKTDLSADLVRSLLDYGPQSGEFRWRERAEAPREWNSRYAGTIAGTINAGGNRQIKIGDRLYYAHRLAWLVVTGEWPKEEIDHRDGNPLNNRIENLREATHSQNAHNRRAYKNNTSGFKGVAWDKSRRKWLVNIQVDGVQQFVGRFATKEEAIKAHTERARQVHGEFAKTNS